MENFMAAVREKLRAFGGRAAGLARRFFPALLAVFLVVSVWADSAVRSAADYKSRTMRETVALDAEGFAETGVFRLTGMQWLDAEDIERCLRIEPPLSFTQVTAEKDSPGAYEARITINGSREVEYTVRLTEPFGYTTLEFRFNTPVLTVSATRGEIDALDGEIAISFNHPVSSVALRDALSVTPYMEFEILKDQVDYDSGYCMIVYKPTDVLPFNATYRFTVLAGLTSRDGVTLKEDYTFEVKTRSLPAEPDGFSAKLTNPAPQLAATDAVIELEFETASREWRDTPLTIQTYRFPSMDKYREQGEMFVRYSFDPAETLEQADTTLGLLNHGLARYKIPNPGEGGYLVEAVFTNPETGGETRLRKLLFVTDVTLYMQTAADQTVAWVNSAATGQPLAGCAVELYAGGDEPVATAVTADDGVAVFGASDTPDAPRNYEDPFGVVVRDAEGRVVYADSSHIVNPYYRGGYDKYYSFFYIDRPIYKPTDEINFWGVVRPHITNERKMPDYVTIALDSGNEDNVVQAKLGPDGAFTGKIAIDQLKSSQYSLGVYLPRDDSDEPSEAVRGYNSSSEYGDYIEGEYIDIKDYKKPMFVIESQTDKDFYRPGDEVEVKITAKFFDGTPLPFQELEFASFGSYYGEPGVPKKITTDKNGVATARFSASVFGEYITRWQPTRNRYMARIAADGENVVHYGEYVFFPVDTMLTLEPERNANGNLDMTVRANEINFGAVTAEMLDQISQPDYYNYYYSDDPDVNFAAALRGKPADLDAQIYISCFYYSDSLGYRERDLDTPAEVRGGVAVLRDCIPVPDIDPRYLYAYAEAKYKDNNGRTFYGSAGFSHGARWLEEGVRTEAPEGYSLDVTNEDGVSRLSEYSAYDSFRATVFGDGDAMSFTLLKDGVPAGAGGRLLYTIIQDGIADRGVTSEGAFTLTQNTAYARSIMLVAAYFDGKEVHPVFDTLINFDLSSLGLNIEVTPDRTEYRPGETVRLGVKITDQNGIGKAAAGCVGVVDEAIFALREQNINVLEELFGDMYFYNTYVRKYTSSLGDIPYLSGGDGGKGGDDNLAFQDSYRKNFKDTAVFLPVTTDASGLATLEFTLPDNTTSWRVTAVAVSGGLGGGQVTRNVISALPFFVSPVISEKYIAGDDVAMLVQGHGKLLAEGDKISYSVRVAGDGFDKTLTAEAGAFEAAELNFGKLPLGEYTVVSTAQTGNYRDTVELPLAVVSSNLELVVNRELDLTRPLDIEALRYPVTISFYDKACQPYYKSISSLLTHYCMIANQRMSRFVAKRSLMKYMDPEAIPYYIRTGNDSAADMQNADGGIGWNVGGESDPMVAVHVLLVAADQFDHKAMTRYFEYVRQGSGGMNRAYATLGLAALGSPVAGDAMKALSDKALPLRERAYYIAALAWAGDTASAKAEYDRVFGPLIKPADVGSRVVAANGDEVTAAAWIAASKIAPDDADAFSLYFAQNRWRIGTLFECMVYVTCYDRPVNPFNVEYEIAGQKQTLRLGPSGQASIRLNRSQLGGFRMVGVPANLRATAYYVGEPSEVGLEPSGNIGIKKEIVPASGGRELVKITLTLGKDAPDGYYDISEWVPSNRRLYRIMRDNYYPGGNQDEGWGSSGDGWWFEYSTEGQKLRFRVYNYRGDKESRTIQLSYLVQKIYNSEAVTDSAYVIHGESGNNAFTPRILP